MTVPLSLSVWEWITNMAEDRGFPEPHLPLTSPANESLSLVSFVFMKYFNHTERYRDCCLVIKSWLTLCNPMDCRLPGSSVHGVSQTRTLEWVAVSLSRGSSWSRVWTHVFCTGRRILYHSATREACTDDKEEYIQVPTTQISQMFLFCHMLQFCMLNQTLDIFEALFAGFPDLVPLSPSTKAITILQLAYPLPFNLYIMYILDYTNWSISIIFTYAFYLHILILYISN